MKIIAVGDTITFEYVKTGDIKKVTIIRPISINKPSRGTGAYYELKTKQEILPPNIKIGEITSNSLFSKQLIGKSKGEILLIYPLKGVPFNIKILNIE